MKDAREACAVKNFWEGKLVRLRAIEPEDAQHFIRWNLDSEMARNLEYVWPPQSSAAVAEWAAQQARKKMENDTYSWIIETLDGVVVGSIDTHHCDHRSGSFMYGLNVDPDHTRKGYASEAIYLVLKYYFEELRYQKVTVRVHANNLASTALHEKLGFVLEGVNRRVLFNHGRYEDLLWYGMTVEEFNERMPA